MILSRSFLARLAHLEAEGRYYVMLDEIQHHLEDGLDEGRWTQTGSWRNWWPGWTPPSGTTSASGTPAAGWKRPPRLPGARPGTGRWPGPACAPAKRAPHAAGRRRACAALPGTGSWRPWPRPSAPLRGMCPERWPPWTKPSPAPARANVWPACGRRWRRTRPWKSWRCAPRPPKTRKRCALWPPALRRTARASAGCRRRWPPGTGPSRPPGASAGCPSARAFWTCACA